MIERVAAQIISLLKISLDEKDRKEIESRLEERVLVLLFSALGRMTIRAYFSSYREAAISVLTKIEEGMCFGDIQVGTAIATGFIEAMISETDKHTGTWQEIETLLGNESRAYATAWRQFTNSEARPGFPLSRE